MDNQKDKSKDLEALEQLETSSKQISSEDDVDFSEIPQSSNNKPNMLDGYKILEREDMPQEGVLYPESWKFAYRCPTSKEVANFSTLNEQDKPGIVAAIEDLIRKCVIIYDNDKDRQINAGQIIDAHRTFFLLLLRDFYLPGNPVKYTGICTLEREPIDIELTHDKLIFSELTEKLINAFDGRSFNLVFPTLEEPIKFLVPTIEITSKIFKYIVKVYKDSQQDHEKKENRIAYDKNFLLMAPYLYETGLETIKDIIRKYENLVKDEKRFKIYLEIITKLKLDNTDYIYQSCPKCGSPEEAQIKFPGGWKNMFISNTDITGYFD